MSISFHPKPGIILMCDFSEGFKPPELVKRRPVLVVASSRERSGLVTVVGISTVCPEPVRAYHYLLPKASMPRQKQFQEKESWVKADMIYTVGFHRLDLIREGKDSNGKRVYFQRRLGREQMDKVRVCVLAGLGMSNLFR